MEPSTTDLTTPNLSFQSLNPATGQPIATWPLQDESDVAAAVARARTASRSWAALGFAGRKQALLAWCGEIARGLDDLVTLIHAENGKPRGDAILEILTAVDHIAWAGGKARSVLGRRRVPAGLLASNNLASVEYQPFGVVGVIGPWNYPVFTPIGSLAYALAAGNAVVFKPSEYTPGVGDWLARAWERAVPAYADAFGLITGDGTTGAALCRSGVDKIAFTGSATTGRKVMAACAENLVPVLMECGGKDAAIVTDDADLDNAVDATLWGAMSNAGQTCLGIERIYVTPGAYDRFVEKITARAAELRAGEDAEASYGPMTMPSQAGVVRRHIDEAEAGGGRNLTGGRVDGAWVTPTVLVDVPHLNSATQEETFGPTVTVTKVADVDEAVRLTNDTRYGLGSAIFTGSGRRGAEIASRIRSGSTSINNVLSFASVPALPMGGVGDSGFGRIHGADGLREFARPKAVTRQLFGLPLAVTSFRRSDRTTELLATMIRLRFGRHKPVD